MTFPGNWLTGRRSVWKKFVFADILADMNTRKTNFWVEWEFNDKLNTRQLFKVLIHSIKVSLDVQKCCFLTVWVKHPQSDVSQAHCPVLASSKTNRHKKDRSASWLRKLGRGWEGLRSPLCVPTQTQSLSGLFSPKPCLLTPLTPALYKMLIKLKSHCYETRPPHPHQFLSRFCFMLLSD